MRRPLLGLLLAGALESLVSLYLPWQEARAAKPATGDELGVLNLFSGVTFDGWSAPVADAAALAALALAAMAAWELVTARRLPLGRAAVLVIYFQLSAAREIDLNPRTRVPQLQVHYEYGIVVALVGAVVLAVAGLALRREELLAARAAVVRAMPAVVLAIAGLVAFLLPFARYGRYVLVATGAPAAVLASIALVSMVTAPRPWRAILACAAAVFTAGVASAPLGVASRAYGWRVASAVAIALFALAIVDTQWKRPRLSRQTALRTAAATVLLIGLFLPAQRVCFDGRCAMQANGWSFEIGAAAGVLALLLLSGAVALIRVAASELELAAGIAVLVATLGLELRPFGPPGNGSDLAYGAFVAFAGAALVVAEVLRRFRPTAVARARLLPRLAPLAVSLTYLAILVLPSWRVLPFEWDVRLRSMLPAWFLVVSILVVIRLFRLWIDPIPTARRDNELVLLPLVLLILLALPVIYARTISWGAGALTGLAVVLAYAGRFERREGIENFRIPAILRVDRL